MSKGLTKGRGVSWFDYRGIHIPHGFMFISFNDSIYTLNDHVDTLKFHFYTLRIQFVP